MPGKRTVRTVLTVYFGNYRELTSSVADPAASRLVDSRVETSRKLGQGHTPDRANHAEGDLAIFAAAGEYFAKIEPCG
jgi:hypothetical protein